MKITREEDYGIILITALSKKGNNTYLPLSQIARKYNLSLFFLKGIAKKLKRAGLIKSKEGKNGGYKLSKNPFSLSYKDIIYAISGVIDISPCCPECDKKTCQSRAVWKNINKKITELLSTIKISNYLINNY